MSLNKKIINAQPNKYDGIEFKSKLETTAYKVFKNAGFNPKYEKDKIIIWRGFKPTTPFYSVDKKTKLLKLNNSKLIDITYTPDFTIKIGKYKIYIEVKGRENDVFPIKRKLFRNYLEKHKNSLYFEVRNKRQMLQAIEIIKNAKFI